MEQTTFPAAPAPKSGNIGPLAAAVVIVLLLAAGGMYFFYTQQVERDAATGPQNQEVTSATQSQTTAPDSTDAMEAELNATQTGGSDADLQGLNDSL